MKFNWLTSLLPALTPLYAVEPGGAVDRGDDFTPTGPDADEVAAADAAAAKLEADIATDKAKAKPEAKAAAPDPDAGLDPEDPDGEPKAEATDKPGKKDSRMPLSRHKEILERERAQRASVEAELAKFKLGSQVAETNASITESETSLLKLEKEYSQLMVDGEATKAAEKMGEIRRLERSIIESKSDMATQAAEARAYERVRYETAVERLEEAYPIVNPDHDDYDASKAAEMMELRDGYIATGKYGATAALQKAAKVLLGAATTRQERAVETDVRVDKEDVAKKVAEERAAAARKKAAETAGKQPPSTRDVGVDSDKMGGKLTPKAVMGMPQDEFAKLDSKTLAELRGDTF